MRSNSSSMVLSAAALQAAAAGQLDDLAMRAAVERAEAAANNTGLGADKASQEAIKRVQSALDAGGAATGEAAANAPVWQRPPSDDKDN
jgi:hypothetical protein